MAMRAVNANNMESTPMQGDSKASYGSISLVKRMQQQLHSPKGSQRVPQAGNLFEPESASLSTDLSFLRGGKQFRSRDRISRFLDHSSFGIVLDVVLASQSVLFVASYILVTYTPATILPGWLWGVELLCASFFGIDFLFRGIYLSNHRLDYVLSLAGLINLIVVLPVLPTSFFHPDRTFWYDANYWRFVYPFRFVKCYLECKAVLSRCHAYMTPVRQFAILCYIQIVLIIAGAAGIIQIAETSDGEAGSAQSDTSIGDWTFFNSFFNSVLVFVTIQTPPADNVLAKIFVGVLVIVLILIVPYQISKVLDLSKSFTEYELSSFKPSRSAKHIVLCGDLTPSRIDHFFHEVFHDDHDVVDINVVVLSDEEPSTAMISLLMDPFFEKRTSFIQGSILDVEDAERAAVGGADAIFILSRRYDQEELMASDHRTLMRVMAAKRLAPTARVFAQMQLSSNHHLLEDLDVKSALYFSEVMHSLLGQNCVCPGFSTLIYNLTSTSNDEGSEERDVWERKYLRSASHELYSVDLPPGGVIFGKSFSEVASLVYANCKGVILFAVQSNALGTQGKILLNPGDTYVCSGDETAFVIAKNRREADQVTAMVRCEMPSEWLSQRGNNPSLTKNGSSANVHSKSSGNATASMANARRKSKTIDWKATVEALIRPVETISEDDEEPGRERLRRATGFTHNLLTSTQRASVDDCVITDLSDLSLSLAHIVVCVVSANAFPHHLEYMIGPLRVKALRRHRPIIIITATLPDEDQFETFRHFKHVYFVKGNPFQQRTLRRACIDSAHKIVIMGDEGDIAESGSSELLADASCVALHKTMATIVGPVRAPRVITQLVNRANVHFITQNLVQSEWFHPGMAEEHHEHDDEAMIHSDDPESGSLTASCPEHKYRAPPDMSAMTFSRDFFVSPAFASGLTYSTSLCDSLMINQYFNPMIKDILREFIFASWKDDDYMTMPVTPPSNFDVNTPTSGVSSAFSPTQGVQRSSLFAVEVPLDFVGKTFEYVFHYLLSSDDMLAIGLYRCRPDRALHNGQARVELKEEERSVPFGYVYVNPFPRDVLTGNDLLYVLSRKQPYWA